MSESEPSAGEVSASGYDPWVERWILPFVRESTLWPILIVIIGHASAFMTAALLIGLREGRFAAAVAVLGLLFISGNVVRYEWARVGRPGALAGVVLATWLLTGLLAYLADRYGLF